MAPPTTIQASEKTLDILELLIGHFAHGLTSGDIVRSSGLDAVTVGRHLQTLIKKGFVEILPETGRFRLSVRFARIGISIMRQIGEAQNALEQTLQRLTTPRQEN
ncbi:MAG: helix-turn-helix domain-containing protein [Magnetococcales bacterium]|nr:helix-turn-helix domain-containing protein [Magnetococcales bacterium]